MSKRASGVEDLSSNQATVFCGIDVSAATLSVAVQAAPEWKLEPRQFANSPAGHRQLLAWLGKRKGLVRVTLEATGVANRGDTPARNPGSAR